MRSVVQSLKQLCIKCALVYALDICNDKNSWFFFLSAQRSLGDRADLPPLGREDQFLVWTVRRWYVVLYFVIKGALVRRLGRFGFDIIYFGWLRPFLGAYWPFQTPWLSFVAILMPIQQSLPGTLFTLEVLIYVHPSLLDDSTWLVAARTFSLVSEMECATWLLLASVPWNLFWPLSWTSYRPRVSSLIWLLFRVIFEPAIGFSWIVICGACVLYILAMWPDAEDISAISATYRETQTA